MRVGVFGGTFDPVHLGHLLLAESAADELALNSVLFIPAGNPYLKAGLPVSSAEHRMTMVRAAVETNPRFEVSDIEVCNPGPSYTIETLERLQAELSLETQVYLLLGLDSLSDMPRWKSPERILERAQIVAYPRAGKHGPYHHCSVSVLGRTVSVLDGPLVGISGTEIRRRVSKGLSIKYLVPDGVIDYIQFSGLYSSHRPSLPA